MKTVCDAALFHDHVCGVARFNFTVYCDMAFGERAVPDIMVAFPMSKEGASIL